MTTAKTIWQHFLSRATSTSDYWLTRFVFLRLIGIIYFFAFLSLAVQVIPLIGEDGLLPADNYLEAVESQFETKWDAFKRLPTLFMFHVSDAWLSSLAWIGVVLSLVVVLGFANVPLLAGIWFLYMSFVHVGQLWYGYGWEIQLLETGFLAIFMSPLVDMRPFPRHPPPVPVIWLLRWLTFRIYLGAGLIKIRGDECWRQLTCMFSHYETQPIPNPVSPLLHSMPQWFHKLGTLWNHFIELVVPFIAFGPVKARHLAGVLLISFQGFLIVSGNLSFLNWLTILPAIALFDDKFLRKFMPKFITRKADTAIKNARKPTKKQHAINWVLVIVIAWLSIAVVQNLLSSNQIMNTSFNQLNLVNTYGAFGSVGKERYELILEGTEEKILTEQTQWKAYEFKAKPGNVNRTLPVVAPYQPRVDWQIWFAAMQSPEQNPWLVHMVWKLLHNDEGTLSLIANNPFPDKPPEYIKIDIYRYEFASSSTVWERTKLGNWLQPLSTSTPRLNEFIEANNWKTDYTN